MFNDIDKAICKNKSFTIIYIIFVPYMIKDILLVMLGSGVGGGLRYAISLTARAFIPHTYLFLSTLAVNLVGSFLMGIIIASMVDSSHNHWFRLLVAIGFCGGFTTFSAFSTEVVELARNGSYILSILYIWASVGISLLCVWSGYALVK